MSPSLMTCGQWSSVLVKNGFVTPRMTLGLVSVCVCGRGGGVYICAILHITKHSSALYIGMAKVLPIIDVLGYDGQNSSFSSSSSSSPPSSSRSDSTPITQKRSHIST